MKDKPLKVLLVFPPVFIHKDIRHYRCSPGDISAPLPFGILSLGSYLAANGLADVRVVSLHSFFERNEKLLALCDGRKQSYIKHAYSIKVVLDRLMKEFPADIVGLSLMMTSEEYPVGVMIKILRTFYPETVVALGGNHATFNAGWLLEQEFAPDIVFLGEGERTMASLLEARFRFQGLNIPGIAYRAESGAIMQTGIAPLLNESDLAHPINPDLMWLPPNRKVGVDLDNNLMYGRGCIYNCSFCSSPLMWRRKVRYKPIQVFTRDVEALVERGAKSITVWDDIINQSRPHFTRFCRALERFEGTKFGVETRLNLVRDEDLDLLARAHVSHVDFGIESCDPVVLRNMNKRQTVEGVEAACLKVKSRGMKVRVNILFGHPGSSPEADMVTIDRLADWCESGLIDEVYGSIFTPLNGTVAGQDPRVRILERDHSKWNNRFPVCELIDPSGRVVYSLEQVNQVYESYLERIVSILVRRDPNCYCSLDPAPAKAGKQG